MPTAAVIATAAKAVGRVQYTGGDCSTNSTTYVDINAALTITVTTNASRCLVVFQAWGQVDGGGGGGTGDMTVALSIDGTVEAMLKHTKGVSGEIKGNLSFVYVTDVLTAGSHTFKPQFSVSSAATTANVISSSTSPATLGVIEL